MAPIWSDDVAKLSVDEVFKFVVENREWSKRLREGTAALVNTRLAKAITQEEYVESRQRCNQDVAECKRRGDILVRDLGYR